MKKMFMYLLLIGFVFGTFVTAGTAAEKKFEGTTKEDLSKITLPVPSQIKVAVLPFYAPIKKEHVKYATEATFKLFQEQGFNMVSQEDAASAFESDTQKEAGEALTKEDALRIGKVAGVDWVVYGKVPDLSTYTKQTFFGSPKKAKVSMKITVLDAKTGEVVYWKQGSDVGGGGSGVFVEKGAALERKIVAGIAKKLMDDLFSATKATK